MQLVKDRDRKRDPVSVTCSIEKRKNSQFCLSPWWDCSFFWIDSLIAMSGWHVLMIAMSGCPESNISPWIVLNRASILWLWKKNTARRNLCCQADANRLIYGYFSSTDILQMLIPSFITSPVASKTGFKSHCYF